MGIDKISQKIIDDAKGQSEQILAEAKVRAQELLEQGEEKIAEKAQAIVDRAQDEAQDIERRQAATTDLEMRKRILGAKRKELESVFDAAKAALPGMPEKDYTSLMEKLLIGCSQVGQGDLYLSARDKGAPKYLETAEKKLNYKFKILGEVPDASGGFVFAMEGMEINCSLENLVDECAGNLETKVSEILFES